jgi:hypothetical protein
MGRGLPCFPIQTQVAPLAGCVKRGSGLRHCRARHAGGRVSWLHWRQLLGTRGRDVFTLLLFRGIFVIREHLALLMFYYSCQIRPQIRPACRNEARLRKTLPSRMEGRQTAAFAEAAKSDRPIRMELQVTARTLTANVAAGVLEPV